MVNIQYRRVLKNMQNKILRNFKKLILRKLLSTSRNLTSTNVNTMEMQEYSNPARTKLERKKLRKFFGHTENISPFAGALFILAVFSLYGIVYLIDDIAPRPLYIVDEDTVVDAFIAERARNDLKDLTDLGPRVLGTHENEIIAVNVLREKILVIIHQAHKNQKIEFDLQVASGVLNPSAASTTVYENVQNIVVKVHAEKYSEHSLLVNAHFDSVPTSSGASDNGINCAVALEVLRKTTQSANTLAHNVIYLFNGAEEVELLGAHAFITQHRWAREIKTFINLDANGVGGKIMLFQTGPKQHWLVTYFSQIALPYAQAAGEEFTERGILPFSTDYNVFTTTGKTIGLNFAFVKNARRYHTRYDDIECIPLSTYQHAGDTVLKLVKSLGNASELARNYKYLEEQSVYYDFMGLFLIYYTKTIGTVINVVVSLFSVLLAVKSFFDFRVPSKRNLKYMVLSFLGLVVGWLVAAGFVSAIAVGLDALNYNMVWYSSTWIVLGLYVIPTFLICLMVSLLFRRFVQTDLTYNMHAQLQSHLLRLIWTVVLIILPLRLGYMVLIPVFFQTAAFLLIHATCSQYTKRTWQIVFFIMTIPGTMYTMYCLLTISSTFLPAVGSFGKSAELIVAFLYFVFTILISSTYVPFVAVLRKSYVVVLVYSAVFVACLAIAFTPIAYPYSDNPSSPALQRFKVIYSNEIIRKGLDNAIYARKQEPLFAFSDRNTDRTLNEFVTVPEFVEETDVIPLNLSTKLTLNTKKYISDTQTHYNFTVDGPSNMLLVISAEENTTIANTKLYLENNAVILKSNTTYHVLRYHRGKDSMPMAIVLKTRHLPKPNAPLLKFKVSATYQYNESTVSIPYFDKYLSQFPSWTNVDSYLEIRDSMIF